MDGWPIADLSSTKGLGRLHKTSDHQFTTENTNTQDVTNKQN